MHPVAASCSGAALSVAVIRLKSARTGNDNSRAAQLSPANPALSARAGR